MRNALGEPIRPSRALWRKGLPPVQPLQPLRTPRRAHVLAELSASPSPDRSLDLRFYPPQTEIQEMARKRILLQDQQTRPSAMHRGQTAPMQGTMFVETYAWSLRS